MKKFLCKAVSCSLCMVLVMGTVRTEPALADDGPGPSTYAEYADGLSGGDPQTRLGMDTWFFWTAGNQFFWGRGFRVATQGEADLLRLLDHRVIPRDQRFEQLGVVNEPGTIAPTGPDEFGFLLDVGTEDQDPLDQLIYGEPTGIVGLRKFSNPLFDPARWQAAGGARGYLAQTSATFDPTLEPPYLIGMSCAVCHVAFDPLSPPSDPNEPTWENLSPHLGNQYLEEQVLFTLASAPDQFRWHVGKTQQPGTSDTSRITNDFINNPTAINPVFALGDRFAIRTHEVISDRQLAFIQNMVPPIPEDLGVGVPPTLLTFRGIIDGADSMGLALATMRVYANIGGLDPARFLMSLPAAHNGFTQQPFDIEAAKAHPSGLWQHTENRLPALETFLLAASPPLPLSQAPGGEHFLQDPPELVEQGQLLFARQCASCHSSKHPDPAITDPELRLQAYEQLVTAPDFLEGNFLSDDRRYPITEVQTNAARALSINALDGQIWEWFSSETYKSLPSAGVLSGLHDPLHPQRAITFPLPDGGRGYYRTPSLISMWATAPYLHNNSVGLYTKDPSVEGRMRAFEDGVQKLLWPERRLGTGSIKRTRSASVLTDALGNPVMVPRGRGQASPFLIPAQTPVNLFANLHPHDLPEVVAAYARNGPRAAMQKALERNRCPDFIEDRGHEYGAHLSDQEKWALIAFLKRL